MDAWVFKVIQHCVDFNIEFVLLYGKYGHRTYTVKGLPKVYFKVVTKGKCLYIALNALSLICMKPEQNHVLQFSEF